ncbi:sulfatase family protein [Ferrimonas pelagia]|uniref:Sulfatase N-terminal domain-containing protein n=1 Tax=Ferrimonas pelagia TaxID=1177826 RepID=A0ABP9ELV4_9GAMM
MAESTHTNFIIVLVDDLGYDEVGFMGSDEMFSPNLDALAAEGTIFRQGYVTSSVCGPSRAGLISGRYQDRFGIWGNFGGQAQKGFPLNQPMLQDTLKQAGYTTGAVGKWHFGHGEDHYRPWLRNFDYFYGFLAGGHDYYRAGKDYSGKTPLWPIHRNEAIVDYPEGNYLTEEFSREAVAFIERNKEEPFFLYLAYNAVHHPWVAPQSYLDRVAQMKEGEFETKERQLLSAMLLAVDDGVGAIRETLKAHDLDQNTAILFLSDNGYQTSIRRTETANTLDFEADLRGFKGDTYEGGIRVPFMIHWPEQVPAGQIYDEPVIALDIAPTITRFLGLDDPQTGYDGTNLIPYLNGSKPEAPHEWLFFRYFHDIAYRKGDWVLTWNDQEKRATVGASRKQLNMAEVDAMLFNLSDDPIQRQDVRRLYPEKFQELHNDYLRLIAEFPEPAFPALFDTPYSVEYAEDL